GSHHEPSRRHVRDRHGTACRFALRRPAGRIFNIGRSEHWNATMNWLALDIGGANLKVADGKGYAQSYAFALWRDSARLAQQIRTSIYEAPPSDHLAVTMTGELADCFESKEAGIRFILQAVSSGSDNRHTRVYLCDGRLVSPQVALANPRLAAASNWHA